MTSGIVIQTSPHANTNSINVITPACQSMTHTRGRTVIETTSKISHLIIITPSQSLVLIKTGGGLSIQGLANCHEQEEIR